MEALPVAAGPLAQEGIVTRAALAAEIEVSEQTIALWEKDGLPVLWIGAQRFYDVGAVARWIRREGKIKEERRRRAG